MREVGAVWGRVVGGFGGEPPGNVGFGGPMLRRSSTSMRLRVR